MFVPHPPYAMLAPHTERTYAIGPRTPTRLDLEHQIEALGQRIEDLEQKIEDLERRNQGPKTTYRVRPEHI